MAGAVQAPAAFTNNGPLTTSGDHQATHYDCAADGYGWQAKLGA